MVRVGSNYVRLILTFALGILIVRLMAELSPDAVLIYVLLVSGGGIAALFKFALQNALVPALGLSIDGRSEHSFSKVLSTSFVFGIIAGMTSLILFGAFWLFSDSLNLGDLAPSAIAFAFAGTAIQTFSGSVGVVFLNVLLVDRRVVAFNALQVLDRFAIFLAALVAFALPEQVSVNGRVQVFYAVGSGLVVLLQIVTYLMASNGRPEMRLRKEQLDRRTSRWIAVFVGWNVLVVVASTLFTRWPSIIVNWSMGEAMTLTISIVLLLIGYQRQISMGLVVGLDAMVSRLIKSDHDSGGADANALILRSTYFLSVFSAFSVCTLGLFVEPILGLWFADTLDGSGWNPATSAMMFRIMSFGIAASILSEGWMKFLSGRGEVAAFAPDLLIAGAVNIAGVFIAVSFLEGTAALFAIAVTFSICFVVVNLGVIAVKTANRIGISVGRLYVVIAIPALLAAVTSIPGVLMHRDGWTLTEAALTLALLAVVGLASLPAARRVLNLLGH